MFVYNKSLTKRTEFPDCDKNELIRLLQMFMSGIDHT